MVGWACPVCLGGSIYDSSELLLEPQPAWTSKNEMFSSKHHKTFLRVSNFKHQATTPSITNAKTQEIEKQ